ncbi:MAG: hypothetical protein K6G18_05695 [Treponema sp.]|nr:hypothetical protein [Treponema sp.]
MDRWHYRESWQRKRISNITFIDLIDLIKHIGLIVFKPAPFSDGIHWSIDEE